MLYPIQKKKHPYPSPILGAGLNCHSLTHYHLHLYKPEKLEIGN